MSNQTKFDIWWNSYLVRRVFSALYSLGAALVILGAMFKILHLEYAEIMLGVGMTTEVIVFALGIFDKPYKEFDWERVFDFKENSEQKLNTQLLSGGMQNQPAQRSTGMSYKESISENDLIKLSEGIKSLTTTAQQLTNLSAVADVTEKFVKNIETATHSARKFTQTQDSLNAEVERLHSSYTVVSDGLEAVEKNTKQYASKVDDINKNLSSINAIYEIQLKSIHVQSEALTTQSESL
ncbi:MAG: gliding motility protein GldL, partial [Paludibacter sp.]|nr:gliding motility protein GldL [Paludibacter sp.]